MSNVSKFTFITPIVDASTPPVPLTAAQIAALKYIVLVDTVTPPVKGFPVPAANIAAGVANPNGSKTVTVLFTDIGFVPVSGTAYFATAMDSLTGGGTSDDANIVTFTNVVTPASPTGFTVA